MSKTISHLWESNKDIFDGKTLEQILKFSGDGKLKDDSNTCKEFRSFLSILPTDTLEVFANECLETTFDSAAYALQDIVNELGTRIGFSVEHGLYRGKRNAIGFDGFWQSSGNCIIVEVKTTDTYSIDLDTIATYRNKLIEEKKAKIENSSILLVVGRKDTGGWEAQIRGSKHAWDMRMISIDSLFKLLRLKEDLLDDENTFKHICQILKPLEFTRLDYLIDTIFITGKDAQAIDDGNISSESDTHNDNEEEHEIKPAPVNFNSECIVNIEKWLNTKLHKRTRTLYDNKEKSIGLTCAVSKNHGTIESPKYWFAFHPHQKESLNKYETAYVSFGCGSADNIFVFEYKQFLLYLDKMWTTEKDDRMYWHIQLKITESGKKCMLLRGDKSHIDVTKNRLSNTNAAINK